MHALQMVRGTFVVALQNLTVCYWKTLVVIYIDISVK